MTWVDAIFLKKEKVKMENEKTEGAEVVVRKRKVLLSFTAPLYLPISGGHVISTHCVIAEIETSGDDVQQARMPVYATIVGLPDGRPLTKARQVIFGFSTVSAAVDFEEA